MRARTHTSNFKVIKINRMKIPHRIKYIPNERNFLVWKNLIGCYNWGKLRDKFLAKAGKHTNTIFSCMQTYIHTWKVREQSCVGREPVFEQPLLCFLGCSWRLNLLLKRKKSHEEYLSKTRKALKSEVRRQTDDWATRIIRLGSFYLTVLRKDTYFPRRLCNSISLVIWGWRIAGEKKRKEWVLI